MRSLRFFGFAASLALLTPSLAAQEATPPPPQAQPQDGPHRGNGDFQKLGLTPEQRQQLKEIRKQYPDDPKARRKAVEGVLTPEQRDKLKELRREHRERRRAPQPPPQS